MDNHQLDKEIISIREAIDQLIELKEYSALKLAQDDLSYYLSLVSK